MTESVCVHDWTSTIHCAKCSKNVVTFILEQQQDRDDRIEAMRQATWAEARRILQETRNFKGASPWGDIHAWLASVDRRMESTSKRPA